MSDQNMGGTDKDPDLSGDHAGMSDNRGQGGMPPEPEGAKAGQSGTESEHGEDMSTGGTTHS